MKKYTIIIFLAGLLAAACVSDGSLVEDPATLMHYRHKPTESKLLDLARSYAESINGNLDNQTMRPGLYADYGVALARLGCKEAACTMFNNEAMLFPASAAYMAVLKQMLVPELAARTDTDTSHIVLSTLDTIHITHTPEETAAYQAMLNDPEYQKQLKARQKAEREQQAIAKKEAQKQKAKDKKVQQKAKAKAKEDERKAKEEAKRAAQQAKEDAYWAEIDRQDSIARAERQMKREQERAERKQQARLDKQRRAEEAVRRKEERKKKIADFGKRYEAWLIKNGYREAPDSTATPQNQQLAN